MTRLEGGGGDREDRSSAGTVSCPLGEKGQVIFADAWGKLAGMGASASIPRCRQEPSPTPNRWHDRLLKDSGWSGSWIRWLLQKQDQDGVWLGFGLPVTLWRAAVIRGTRDLTLVAYNGGEPSGSRK